jgi:CRP-like cAMP-binding protein
MSDITDKIERYLNQYPRRTYASGETILFAHENPKDIFYLVSGKVNMFDVSPKGNEVVINVYEPGRFFPLSWALSHTPNKYFFKTEAPSMFRLIPPDDLMDFIFKNPDVGVELLRRIHQKADRFFERIVYLMSATAARRLTYELVVECLRFGKQQPDGSVFVAVREVDLASRSGLSRETVSREFQKLKEAGYVQLEKQGIRVFNLTQLEATVGVIP